MGAASVGEFFKLRCFCFEPIVVPGFQSTVFGVFFVVVVLICLLL